jgi:hypothetical protein
MLSPYPSLALKTLETSRPLVFFQFYARAAVTAGQSLKIYQMIAKKPSNNEGAS